MRAGPDEAISDAVASLLDDVPPPATSGPNNRKARIGAAALLEFIDDGDHGYLAGLCLVLGGSAVAR